jgi:hypothetical protein
MAEFGQPEEIESLIPKITQETLAAMIGTTRFRVRYFATVRGFLEVDPVASIRVPR